MRHTLIASEMACRLYHLTGWDNKTPDYIQPPVWPLQRERERESVKRLCTREKKAAYVQVMIQSGVELLYIVKDTHTH